MASPRISTSIIFLVDGCPGRDNSCTNLQLHYMPHHLEDIIVVLNEVPDPYPRCKYCNIFFPRRQWQKETQSRKCAIGVRLKNRRLAATTTHVEALAEFRA